MGRRFKINDTSNVEIDGVTANFPAAEPLSSSADNVRAGESGSRLGVNFGDCSWATICAS